MSHPERAGQTKEPRDSRPDLLRAVMDHVPGWLALTDAEGRYIVVNHTYQETFGKPPEEVEGRTFHEVFPEIVPRHGPLIEACRAGQTVPFEDVLFFKPGRATHVHGAYHPILGPDGAVRFMTLMAMDVTDLAEANQARERTQELLDVTLRSITDAVVSVDPDGHVLFMNAVAEQLTGWDSEEARGRRVREVACLDEPAKGANARTLVSRTGARRVVDLVVSPMRDRAGKGTGEVWVLRDASERLRQDAERVRAQKLESLAVLAGGIAHDFNNLLTGIIGNLSLALSRPDLPAELRADLENAEKAGKRSRGLTRQLLTFARGGAPVRQVVNLRHAIQQSAGFAVTGAPVGCRVEVDPDLWPAEADEGQVGQVVQNLVLNGAEAMPGGGEVRVMARNRTVAEGEVPGLPAGPYLCLRVEDQGVGIPEDLRARVFDPYFSTKNRRSGLGLAITHSIVKGHAGWVGLAGRDGPGTTVEVLLPARPGAGVPDGQGSAGRPGRVGAVLVMDDDAMVREFAARALSLHGWRVATAPDGQEAVRLYRQARAEGRPFDVVITDLTVPGAMGGLETAAVLRQEDPGARLVVMSGYCDDPVLAHHARHGFCGVVPKPFTVEAIRAAVEAALAPCPGEVRG